MVWYLPVCTLELSICKCSKIYRQTHSSTHWDALSASEELSDNCAVTKVLTLLVPETSLGKHLNNATLSYWRISCLKCSVNLSSMPLLPVTQVVFGNGKSGLWETYWMPPSQRAQADLMTPLYEHCHMRQWQSHCHMRPPVNSRWNQWSTCTRTFNAELPHYDEIESCSSAPWGICEGRCICYKEMEEGPIPNWTILGSLEKGVFAQHIDKTEMALTSA